MASKNKREFFITSSKDYEILSHTEINEYWLSITWKKHYVLIYILLKKYGKAERDNSHCCQSDNPITIKFSHVQVVTIGLSVHQSSRPRTPFSVG